MQKHVNGKRLLFFAPLALVKPFASLCERISLKKRRPLFLTPYSIYTLCSNSRFSHERATRELDYHPRPIDDTLRDMVQWLRASGQIRQKAKNAKA